MNREERAERIAPILVQAVQAGEDVGNLVAAALKLAAQELGSVDDLIRGRPGSWEAEIVLKMGWEGGTEAPVERVDALVPLFVEMGKAREDGGEVISMAMGKAVDVLGSVQAFASGSQWYWDLQNISRPHSNHWNDPWGAK